MTSRNTRAVTTEELKVQFQQMMKQQSTPFAAPVNVKSEFKPKIEESLSPASSTSTTTTADLEFDIVTILESVDQLNAKMAQLLDDENEHRRLMNEAIEDRRRIELSLDTIHHHLNEAKLQIKAVMRSTRKSA